MGAASVLGAGVTAMLTLRVQAFIGALGPYVFLLSLAIAADKFHEFVRGL
jgi:hypothetical protein